MIRIAVVDDEEKERAIISQIVDDFFSENKLEYNVNTFTSGEALLSDKNEYDLIFLDIQMNGIDGIETAQKLRVDNKKVALFYVTSYHELIRKSMTIHPFAFIVKPYSKQDIFDNLEDYLAYTSSAAEKEKTATFQIHTIDDHHTTVELSKIIYFHYLENRTVDVVTADNVYKIRETISNIYSYINNKRFLIPNQSFIINLEQIKEVDGQNKKLIMSNMTLFLFQGENIMKSLINSISLFRGKECKKMQYILDCATMILTSLLCFLMLYRKFDIHKEHLILRITGVVLINAIKMGAMLLSIPILNLMTTCLISVLIVRLIYKCSIKTTIIYSFIFTLIAFISDILAVLIVSNFFGNTITETLGTSDYVWHRHIWIWILMIILSRITAMFIKQNYNIRTKWYEMAFYLFMLGFEVAFFIAVSNAIQDYMSGQFLIFIMSGFVVLDIGVIFILRKISLLRDTEQQLLLMKQQENLQLQMYSELNKKYDSAREISHDINRHITSLEALIKAEHNEQAERYFSDLSKAADRLNPVIKNQNSMLAIILNTVSDRCIKDDIRLDLNVEDFSLGFISDIDMTTIFSNLLDNAIDACLELSKSRRYISFVLKKQIGLIVVNITNPCDDNAEVSVKRSTKEKHSGIGLMNVRKAVDKYDGVFSLNKSNEEFCVSITFNENRRNNVNWR